MFFMQFQPIYGGPFACDLAIRILLRLLWRRPGFMDVIARPRLVRPFAYRKSMMADWPSIRGLTNENNGSIRNEWNVMAASIDAAAIFNHEAMPTGPPIQAIMPKRAFVQECDGTFPKVSPITLSHAIFSYLVKAVSAGAEKTMKGISVRYASGGFGRKLARREQPPNRKQNRVEPAMNQIFQPLQHNVGYVPIPDQECVLALQVKILSVANRPHATVFARLQAAKPDGFREVVIAKSEVLKDRTGAYQAIELGSRECLQRILAWVLVARQRWVRTQNFLRVD